MSINLFLKIVEISEGFSFVISILAFSLFTRRSFETKLVGIFFLLDVLTFIFIHVVPLHGKEINVPQTACGTFQFLVATTLYYVAFNRKYKKPLVIVASLLFVLSISNLLFLQGFDMNSYTNSLTSVIILVYCMVYWYRLMVELPVQQLHRFPMFWFNSAFLIFSAGTLFLYLFAAYLTEVLHNDLLIYWSFHNILSIVQRIVIMIGLWQDLRNIKLGSSLPQVR